MNLFAHRADNRLVGAGVIRHIFGAKAYYKPIIISAKRALTAAPFLRTC